MVKNWRAAFVPVLGLVLLLVPVGRPAAEDGAGRVEVTPARVTAGSTNTFTLVFSADGGTLDGQTLIDIPRGWSPPQQTRRGALGYVAFARGSCSSGTKLTRIVARRLIIATSCTRGQSFTVTYGPAAATTLAADGYVFLTQTRPSVGITKTKLVKVKKVVKTKRGKKRVRTSYKRVTYVVKPAFRPLAQKKQPVVVVTGAPVHHLAINAPTIVTSGTPFTINVRAEDVYGNVACCYTGTVSFSSSDPEAFLPTPYTFATADLGAKNFGRVILRTIGAQTITVSDAAGHVDTSNPVNVFPFPTG
ncbi:MAG TPA: hypothetical protein VGJ58_00645 [Gaiellaceae bacterium]